MLCQCKVGWLWLCIAFAMMSVRLAICVVYIWLCVAFAMSLSGRLAICVAFVVSLLGRMAICVVSLWLLHPTGLLYLLNLTYALLS